MSHKTYLLVTSLISIPVTMNGAVLEFTGELDNEVVLKSEPRHQPQLSVKKREKFDPWRESHLSKLDRGAPEVLEKKSLPVAAPFATPTTSVISSVVKPTNTQPSPAMYTALGGFGGWIVGLIGDAVFKTEDFRYAKVGVILGAVSGYAKNKYDQKRHDQANQQNTLSAALNRKK